MRQIIKIKIVLVVLVVVFTYTQCTNPYSAQPSKLKFSSGEDAGALSTSSSVAAFEDSVYQVTRTRCIGCHSTQNPVHASDDVKEAHDIVVDQFKVNFSNIPSSRLVAKLRDEAHNCWSDCSENAQEMEEAIQRWAEVVNNIEEEEEEENTDEGSGGDDGSTGSEETDETIISGLSSQEAFEQSVYPITKQRCTTCHITRFPRHASNNAVVAHNDLINAQSVDLDDPINSRLVQRLGNESHQCWSNCADNANEMKEAIEKWKLNKVLIKHAVGAKKVEEPVVILGKGETDKKLNIKAHRISKSAQEMVEKAGGSYEKLDLLLTGPAATIRKLRKEEVELLRQKKQGE